MAEGKRLSPLRVWVGKLRVAGALLAALVPVAFIASASISSCNRTWWSYKFRQHKLAAIVQEIKSEPIVTGKSRFFEIDPSLDPSTLKPLNSQDDAAGLCKIAAFQRSKGDFIIEFVLDDRGHFGMSGLLYSDSRLEFTRWPGSGSVDMVQYAFYLHRVSRQIDSRWSFAYDDLE